MVKKLLPPGFRFHPTDVELILYYLKRMILGKKFHYKAIAEVNIYKYSPWDLPDKSCLKTKDLEWFFFCPREKKYQSGVRVKRATENGYWKTTGKDRIISFNEKTIGTVKTLIFHLGHAPQGERTNWVIHEYKILDDQLAKDGLQDNYVLCKLFEKNGLGPKNGAQYGAPFNEADWSDDDDDDGAQDCPISLAADPCPTVFTQNEEQSLPLGCCFGIGNGSPPIVVEGPSSSTVAPTCIVAVNDTNDEMSHLLNSIVDEDMPLPNGFGLNEDDLIGNGMNILHPCEGWNIYNGLHDLDSWTEMHECGIDLSGVQNVDYSLNSMLPEDNSNYIELNDLLLPLDCSNGVTRAHIPSLCQTSVSYGHGNIQEVYSGTFAGMDQCTSFVNDLAVLPDTSEVDNSLNVLQTGEFPFYQGSNSSYNLDFPFVELENAFYSPQDMERGSNLENRYSRFMECVPAQLPSAAELLALKYSPCGGSSIHIKAEVTHGAGECTNEALSVMMEGSSSCWCNLLFRKVQPWAVEVLLNLVEFISDLIMVNCLIEAVSSSYHFYIRNESPSYSPRQPKLVISLNHLFVCYYYN